MISKKSLVAVLDKSITLTIAAPNDNANQDPVQCALADFSLSVKMISYVKFIIYVIKKVILSLLLSSKINHF